MVAVFYILVCTMQGLLWINQESCLILVQRVMRFRKFSHRSELLFERVLNLRELLNRPVCLELLPFPTTLAPQHPPALGWHCSAMFGVFSPSEQVNVFMSPLFGIKEEGVRHLSIFSSFIYSLNHSFMSSINKHF